MGLYDNEGKLKRKGNDSFRDTEREQQDRINENMQNKAEQAKKQRAEQAWNDAAPERERQAQLDSQRAAIEKQRAETEARQRFNDGLANQAKAQSQIAEDNAAEDSKKPHIVGDMSSATIDGSEASSAEGNKRRKRNQLSSLLGI